MTDRHGPPTPMYGPPLPLDHQAGCLRNASPEPTEENHDAEAAPLPRRRKSVLWSVPVCAAPPLSSCPLCWLSAAETSAAFPSALPKLFETLSC